MANDMEILRKAYERENDPRERRPPEERYWEFYNVGATRKDIARLVDEGLVVLFGQTRLQKHYRLSARGRDLVWSEKQDREYDKIPATSILDAMSLVIGFDDVKQTIADTVERRQRMHFILEGPPACAKSLLLEAVRSTVPDSYMAFGSRTSSSGLSDILFEHKPSVLLMDEADKIHQDVFSVMLGLMEAGEVIETKSKKTRGVKLETMVIAACNSSAKMPPEFLSRFALHIHFPIYTRQEFVDVCVGFLGRAEDCPKDVAVLIGESIYDNKVGDVRKARAAWQLMKEPTAAEVQRVVQLMLKYGPEVNERRRRQQAALPI